MNIDDLKKIAAMSYIQMSEEELKRCDLADTLQFIDQIKNVDTSHVTPLAHPLDISQILREDHVTETNEREHLQKLIDPNQVESGLYFVPNVIDSEKLK